MEKFFALLCMEHTANYQLFVYLFYTFALVYRFSFIFLFSFHNIPCLRFPFVISTVQHQSVGVYRYWLASDRNLKWEGRRDININPCFLQRKITLKYCYEDFFYVVIDFLIPWEKRVSLCVLQLKTLTKRKFIVLSMFPAAICHKVLHEGSFWSSRNSLRHVRKYRNLYLSHVKSSPIPVGQVATFPLVCFVW